MWTILDVKRASKAMFRGCYNLQQSPNNLLISLCLPLWHCVVVPNIFLFWWILIFLVTKIAVSFKAPQSHTFGKECWHRLRVQGGLDQVRTDNLCTGQTIHGTWRSFIFKPTCLQKTFFQNCIYLFDKILSSMYQSLLSCSILFLGLLTRNNWITNILYFSRNNNLFFRPRYFKRRGVTGWSNIVYRSRQIGTWQFVIKKRKFCLTRMWFIRIHSFLIRARIPTS